MNLQQSPFPPVVQTLQPGYPTIVNVKNDTCTNMFDLMKQYWWVLLLLVIAILYYYYVKNQKEEEMQQSQPSHN